MVTIMIYSCKGCVAPKRYPGCHSHCPEYLAERAEHDRKKAEADKKKMVDAGLTAQTLVGVNRAHKAQRRMKGK